MGEFDALHSALQMLSQEKKGRALECLKKKSVLANNSLQASL